MMVVVVMIMMINIFLFDCTSSSSPNTSLVPIRLLLLYLHGRGLTTKIFDDDDFYDGDDVKTSTCSHSNPTPEPSSSDQRSQIVWNTETFSRQWWWWCCWSSWNQGEWNTWLSPFWLQVQECMLTPCRLVSEAPLGGLGPIKGHHLCLCFSQDTVTAIDRMPLFLCHLVEILDPPPWPIGNPVSPGGEESPCEDDRLHQRQQNLSQRSHFKILTLWSVSGKGEFQFLRFWASHLKCPERVKSVESWIRAPMSFRCFRLVN